MTSHSKITFVSKKQDSDLSYTQNCKNTNDNKTLIYKKQLKEKEILISNLNKKVSDLKIKCLFYEDKISALEKQYSEFESNKKSLDESINFLSENLISKEKRINELETINIDMEKELKNSKEKISKLENINVEKDRALMSLQNKLSAEEKIGIDNENLIIYLENQIYNQKNDNAVLIEEIQHLKDEIIDLTSQLASAKTKLKNSFFTKILNNK